MRLPDRLRLPLAFDAVRLQADLARLEGGAWVRHFVTQNYDGDWSVLPLRGAAGATHPVMMIYADPTSRAFADTPFMAACAYVPEVISAFRCEVTYVRLMRLTAGSVIKTHRDHDLDPETGVARIHMPVVTNAGVDFRLNGSRVEMATGEAWCLRLSDPHSVANRGAADRVHLVLDLVVNDWVREMMRTAAHPSPVAAEGRAPFSPPAGSSR